MMMMTMMMMLMMMMIIIMNKYEQYGFLSCTSLGRDHWDHSILTFPEASSTSASARRRFTCTDTHQAPKHHRFSPSPTHANNNLIIWQCVKTL